MATLPTAAKCVLFLVLFVLFTYAQIHETIIMTDTLHASKNSPAHINSDGPRIGRAAPDFEADAAFKGEFVKLRLSSYRGKYVVLLFYPLDFTFVCPTELIAFSDRYDEFKELNTEVIGVSVDSKFTHLAWINTPRKEGGVGRLNIPLVSDMTKRISRDYRVLVEEGQDAGVALRGLFIINEHGIIRQITVNDLPVGRSVDETLRLVKAFQYTDIHGEVCPANWTPGARTMVPDPQKSKDYFHKVHDNNAHC